MFTIDILVSQRKLRAWNPGGGRMCERLFYYSEIWAQERRKLPGADEQHRVQWWDDDDSTEIVNDDEVELNPNTGLSVCDRLDGLIETFVIGWPRAQLVRKQGFGMDPPFRRMNASRSIVVEMRTFHTRTFGFFVRPRTYVALRLDLADVTHANTDLYEEYGDYVLKVLNRISVSDKDTTSDIETLIGD